MLNEKTSKDIIGIIEYARKIKSGKLDLSLKGFSKWAFEVDVLYPMMRHNYLLAIWRFIKFPFIINKAYNKFVEAIDNGKEVV